MSYKHQTASELRISVLLSVQRALVGEITKEMRAISVEWSAERIQVWVYVDGPIDKEAQEEFDASVMTQIVSDFPDVGKGDPAANFVFVQCDAPQRLDYRGWWVYARKEEYY